MLKNYVGFAWLIQSNKGESNFMSAKFIVYAAFDSLLIAWLALFIYTKS